MATTAPRRTNPIKKSDPLAEGEVQPDISNEIPLVGEGQQDIFTTLDAHWWEGGQVMEASETFEPRQLDTPPLDEMVRKQGGRRSQTRSKTKRGRYIAARHAPQATPATSPLTPLCALLRLISANARR